VVPLSHVKAIIIQTRYSRFAIVIKLVRKDLRGYHLLWPDLPTFSEFLEEGAKTSPSPYCKFSPAQGQGKRGSLSRGPFPFLCLIRFRSLLLTESQLISFPLATMMFQFAKSLESEAEPQHTACPASLDTVSRLETHGSQTVSPHGLSPLEASFLLNAQASIQCILFDAVGIEPTEHRTKS